MIQNQNQFMVAEVELSYKTTFNINDRPKINSSRQAYEVFMGKWDLNKIELVEVDILEHADPPVMVSNFGL